MDNSDACARQCQISTISLLLQILVAILFVFVCLWAASLLLEPLKILGITTVPPGIAYVDYDRRA